MREVRPGRPQRQQRREDEVNARYETGYYPHGILTSLILEVWFLVKKLVTWW
jgi:hypothetical protein